MKYEFTVTGDYTNYAGDLQVCVRIRSIPKAGGTPNPVQTLLLITAHNPTNGDLYPTFNGLTKDPNKPQNASFTGVAQRATNYDATMWDYEVQMELQSYKAGDVGGVVLQNAPWTPLVIK